MLADVADPAWKLCFESGFTQELGFFERRGRAFIRWWFYLQIAAARPPQDDGPDCSQVLEIGDVSLEVWNTAE